MPFFFSGRKGVPAVSDLQPAQLVALGLWWTSVGLAVGSYLNVVVHRLPRGQSTAYPSSHCPTCGEPIKARFNLPIVGYLILRGRSACCSLPIGMRYPLVELAGGLLFLGCFLRFGPNPTTVVASTFAAILLALGLIDADHFLLPNRITYPAIAVGLLSAPFSALTTPYSSLLGALLGASLLLLLIGGWYLVRRELGMGFGDVKMLAMIGAWLGVAGMMVTLILSAVSGAAIGILFMARGAGLKARLPFGVFLSLGALIALFFGNELAQTYLDAFRD